MHGPYKPDRRPALQPNKLLLDPYAKDFVGELRWHDALYGYTVGDPEGDLSFDPRNSASSTCPRAACSSRPSPGATTAGRASPWHDMVVYEMHVRGFSMRHPEVPEPLRGSYAALASAPAINYLRALGITTVELMPVHAFVNDRYLAEKGLRNYWGYNTQSFFAPEMRYASSQKVKEFKTMVKTLHSAGIEVILDVVYNHSCEGNQLGPTLSFRGIDNAAYYILADDPRYYADFTGCGNTVNMAHPRALQMVMDSLRYWVEEMHVDGFRFDLASALARERGKVDHLGGFFDVIRQDPTLNRVKLIAEPWDLGMGGYQVGNFPLGWAEWNDRYRDGMRAYWKGDGGLIGDVAKRLTGSSDLYGRSGKRPQRQHQLRHRPRRLHAPRPGQLQREAQRGQRRRQPRRQHPQPVVELRRRRADRRSRDQRVARAAKAQLPGDADSCRRACRCWSPATRLSRTQGGNNNAYCQDNEISWLDWSMTDDKSALLGFVRRLIALRRSHPTFRRRDFFAGRALHGGGLKDLLWLKPDGLRDVGCRMGAGIRALSRHVPLRLRHRRCGPARPTRSSTTTSW